MSRAGQIFIIVLGLLFISKTSFGQYSLQKIDWNNIAATHVTSTGFSLANAPIIKIHHPFFPAASQELNIMGQPGVSVASDMSVKNLAFFCRQELKVEKTLKIPVKLRMGSLAQANALEGKK